MSATANAANPRAGLEDRFLADVFANRHNRSILERWDALALPDAWLVAGCLFQTVWNLQSGRAPEADIKDYDLFYFDCTDLSETAERQVQARVGALFADLGVAIEASNQARVHLWYESYFGHPYGETLQCSRDGIERFLVPATCVGVRPDALYAPYGLAQLYEGVLTMNPLKPHLDLFERKAASYRARWPWLRIEELAQASAHPGGALEPMISFDAGARPVPLPQMLCAAAEAPVHHLIQRDPDAA